MHDCKVSVVAIKVSLSVELIAYTQFTPPQTIAWTTEAHGAEALVEFAGRACYETWSKPNPHTAKNTDYLKHLIEVGHFSILEHPSATFYITGISRGCAQELIRHRHLSCSQLSQRYVPNDELTVVIPPDIAGNSQLEQLFLDAVDRGQHSYTQLVNTLQTQLPSSGSSPGSRLRSKQHRQGAQTLLPDARETRMVITGNYRAWRHFIAVRASEYVDLELRQLAVRCLRLLTKVAPAIFEDFVITQLADGSEVATSPLVAET